MPRPASRFSARRPQLPARAVIPIVDDAVGRDVCLATELKKARLAAARAADLCWHGSLRAHEWIVPADCDARLARVVDAASCQALLAPV